MTPRDRDWTHEVAAELLGNHSARPLVPNLRAESPVCVCTQCRLCRAVLAFIPPGDAIAPEGFDVAPDQHRRRGFVLRDGVASNVCVLVHIPDAATMRALGLYLVAQADAIASQGEGGKGGR